MNNKPNIILISIDTLRYDHLGCYGYTRGDISPNIDQFASTAVLYKNAYSTAVWTPPAHASMLTGLYPSQHGVVHQNILDKQIPVLAELLAKSGYQTAGFVNNSQVGEMVGLDRGYNDFYEIWKGYSRKQLVKLGLDKIKSIFNYADKGAKQTNHLIYEWFAKKRNKSKPFHLFIHHIEPHNPLGAPKPFLHKYLNGNTSDKIDQNILNGYAKNPLVHYAQNLKPGVEENQALIDLYDEEICYTDAILADLFHTLKQFNVYDDSIIILTADHGEHFGEHDLYSHVASLYEPIIHIPLIVKYQKADNLSEEIDSPVQLIDILPTSLSMVDLNTDYLKSLPGEILSAANSQFSERIIFAEWEGRTPLFLQNHKNSERVKFMKNRLDMIRIGNEKLIRHDDETMELYDINTDPKELVNLANKTNVRKLIEELETFRNSIVHNDDFKEYEVTDQITKNLKLLGYF